MVMKAIDKSNSPLWIRILVWILVAGLMAAAVFMAVGVIMTWGDEPAPMAISADDLPPEILAELEAQLAEQAASQDGDDLDQDEDYDEEPVDTDDGDADSDEDSE